MGSGFKDGPDWVVGLNSTLPVFSPQLHVQVVCLNVFQNHMDLAKGHIKALQEGDLASSRGIEACTNAADALLQCMNVALRPGMFSSHNKI